MGVKKTTDKIDQLTVGRNLVRIDPYVGYDSKITWECTNCANQWLATPNNIITKHSGCPVCSTTARGQRKSNSQLPRIQHILGNRNITLVSPYTRIVDRHTYNCNVCLFEWSTDINNLINSGSGCPSCAGVSRVTNARVDSRLHSGIMRVTDVVNMTTKVEWRCVKNHSWLATPDSVLNLKSGCSKCNRLGFQTKSYFKRHPEKRQSPGTIYLIEAHDGNNPFLKVGITEGSVSRRFASTQNRYNIQELLSKQMTLGEAYDLEQQLLKKWHHHCYVPTGKFSGKTECLLSLPEISQDIIASISDFSCKDKPYAQTHREKSN